MYVPSRCSDAGPRFTENFDPIELTYLAEDALARYRKAKEQALTTTTRREILKHLREALSLIDRADDIEIGAIEAPEAK